MTVHDVSIAVFDESPDRRHDSEKLAASLHLPVVSILRPDYQYFLVYTADYLELRPVDKKSSGPIRAEFLNGKAAYRRRKGGGRGQLIARAAGLKKGTPPVVLDCTAGLGRDAFALACLGCRVHMIERSPIIAVLLQDALQRALDDPEVHPIAAAMDLVVGDALQMRQAVSAMAPDVILIDPMYPQRSKNALVKKEMRLLREIVGNDQDAPLLFSRLQQYAGQRVIIKRHKGAPFLTEYEPDLSMTGSKSRFDIYLTR